MTNQQNPSYQQSQKDKNLDKNAEQKKSFENKDKSGKPGERPETDRGSDRA